MSSFNTNVYCHNVPLHWDKAELEECFKPYGTIVSSRVLKNPQTNVSRGVCFVRFQTHEEAAAAIAKVNNTIPAGGSAPILAKFAKENNNNGGGGGGHHQGHPGQHPGHYQQQYSQPQHYGQRGGHHGQPRGGYGKPEEDRTNLYIQNLPITHTDEDIKVLFSGFGTVVSTFILTDRETGASRGIGFCRMSQEPDATAAMTALSGQPLPGATAPLNITFARDSKRKTQAPPQFPPQYGQPQYPYSNYPYPPQYGQPPQHGGPQYGQPPQQQYAPIGAPPNDYNGPQYGQPPQHISAYSPQQQSQPYSYEASDGQPQSPYAYTAVNVPTYGAPQQQQQ